MTEIWKPISGYEGLYEVSNLGNVRSLDYRCTGKTCLLMPRENGRGYLRVDLCKDGKQRHFPVHRLVAQAFIPNPLGKPTVNHKNEIKTDNSVDNLEWMTVSENNAYGTHPSRVISNLLNCNNSRKVPLVAFTASGEFVGRFESQKEAAQKLGVNVGNISNVRSGKRSHTQGYVFKKAS